VNGYVIVGMRVQGDTMPRPTDSGTGAPNESTYFTEVINMGYPQIVEQ
jgi:hypothetical protein